MPASVSSLIAALAPIRASGVVAPDRAIAAIPVQVWHVLSTVPDPRHARGIRHRLASVLAVALAAVVAGAGSVEAIASWAADLPRRYWTDLGIVRGVPSRSTLRRILTGVDADVLDAVLAAWLATGAVAAGMDLKVIAADGKTCRGSRGADTAAAHLFSIAAHYGGGIPLGQVNAGGEDHEIAAFPAVLDRLDLHGVIITADALHTQRAHAHYLHRHGAHYVFIAKAKQPTVCAQLTALPWAQVPIVDHVVGKGHGSREERTLQVIDLSGKGAPKVAFPHVRQAFRVVRTRTMGSAASTEIVHGITSLPWSAITAAELARIIRGHWLIENAVHYVRDVSYREDHSRIRTGNGPRVMATLRNIALGLLRIHHPGAPIAATLRHLGRTPDAVLTLLDSPSGHDISPSERTLQPDQQ